MHLAYAGEYCALLPEGTCISLRVGLISAISRLALATVTKTEIVIANLCNEFVWCSVFVKRLIELIKKYLWYLKVHYRMVCRIIYYFSIVCVYECIYYVIIFHNLLGFSFVYFCDVHYSF